MSDTIFQRIVKETQGKPKSGTWYRNKVRQLTISGGYNLNPGKLILDERKDMSKPKKKQDSNKIKFVLEYGKIYMFDYDPKMQLKLPYYDKFPLAYIMKGTDDGFYAYNLHYLNIKRRLEFLAHLKAGQVHVLRNQVFRYLSDPKYMNGIFLEIGESEWEIAAHLPVENFFTNLSGVEIPIPKTFIWQKTERLTRSYYKEKRRIGRIII